MCVCACVRACVRACVCVCVCVSLPSLPLVGLVTAHTERPAEGAKLAPFAIK